MRKVLRYIALFLMVVCLFSGMTFAQAADGAEGERSSFQIINNNIVQIRSLAHETSFQYGEDESQNDKNARGYRAAEAGSEIQYKVDVLSPGSLKTLTFQCNGGLEFLHFDGIFEYGTKNLLMSLFSEESQTVEIQIPDLLRESIGFTIYYTVKITDGLTMGTRGNQVLVNAYLDNGEMVSSPSESVYSFDMSLHVVDTAKEMADTTAYENGINVYSGQGVSGVSYEIYRDVKLTDKVGFVTGFRQYTVDDGTSENYVTRVTTDNSGRLELRGFSAGTYYICTNGNKETPIPVTIGLARDEESHLYVISTIEDATNPVEIRPFSTGARIIYDMTSALDTTLLKDIIAFMVCFAMAIGVACIIVVKLKQQ